MNSAIVVTLLIAQGVICGGFCAWLAVTKGREGLWWFLLGFGFSIVALVALAGAPVRTAEITERQRKEEAA